MREREMDKERRYLKVEKNNNFLSFWVENEIGKGIRSKTIFEEAAGRRL